MCLLFLWHRLMTSLCFLLGGFHVVIAVTRIALMIIWVAVVTRAVCVSSTIAGVLFTSIRASSIFFIWVHPQIFIVQKDPSVADSLVAEVRLVLVTNTRTQSADFRVSSFFFFLDNSSLRWGLGLYHRWPSADRSSLPAAPDLAALLRTNSSVRSHPCSAST